MGPHGYPSALLEPPGGYLTYGLGPGNLEDLTCWGPMGCKGPKLDYVLGPIDLIHSYNLINYLNNRLFFSFNIVLCIEFYIYPIMIYLVISFFILLISYII
jgi:hypothetical protein